MKILNIVSTIKKKISVLNYEKTEKNIQKYCRIHYASTYGDSYEQMYNARKVIANFAEKNSVSVDIYDAKKLSDGDEPILPVMGDKFSNKLNVVVSDLRTGKSENKIVDANTDILYPKIYASQYLSPVLGEGNSQVITQVISATEDTFLRNLYRNIQDLTKNLISHNL